MATEMFGFYSLLNDKALNLAQEDDDLTCKWWSLVFSKVYENPYGSTEEEIASGEYHGPELIDE